MLNDIKILEVLKYLESGETYNCFKFTKNENGCFITGLDIEIPVFKGESKIELMHDIMMDYSEIDGFLLGKTIVNIKEEIEEIYKAMERYKIMVRFEAANKNKEVKQSVRIKL